MPPAIFDLIKKLIHHCIKKSVTNFRKPLQAGLKLTITLRHLETYAFLQYQWLVEVRKFINESPTKSCILDPIPTFLLKDSLDIILPYITKLVNYSLIEGSFPNAFKKVVVISLIKKASLPGNDLKNYRPVSGLCFLSKLVD